MSQGKWSLRSLLFITFLLWVIINIIAYNCRILNRLDETLLLYCYSGVRKSKYEILTSTFPFRTPSKVKIISQFPSDATKRLKYYSLIPESTHYLNNQTEIKRAILRIHGLHVHLCSEVSGGFRHRKETREVLYGTECCHRGLWFFFLLLTWRCQQCCFRVSHLPPWNSRVVHRARQARDELTEKAPCSSSF